MIYFVTGGNNWNKKQNWTNFDKESNWYGVSFNEHSEVVGLKLPNNALVGNVSEEVSKSRFQFLIFKINITRLLQFDFFCPDSNFLPVKLYWKV